MCYRQNEYLTNLHQTKLSNLSIFLILGETASEDGDSVPDPEKLVLQQSECCIVFR